MITLEALAARVDRLERTNLRLRMALAGAVFIATVAALASMLPHADADQAKNPAAPTKELRVETLKICDSSGRARIVLTTQVNERPSLLSFADEHGNARASLFETKEGFEIELRDKDEKRRVSLIESSLALLDQSEKPRALLVAGDKGAGFGLIGTNEKPRLSLEENGLRLLDATERVRLALAQFDDREKEPTLAIFSPQGEVTYTTRNGRTGEVPVATPPVANPAPAPARAAAAVDKERLAATKLKLARELMTDRNFEKARTRLQQIIKDFPGTKAAADAAKLINEIDK